MKFPTMPSYKIFLPIKGFCIFNCISHDTFIVNGALLLYYARNSITKAYISQGCLLLFTLYKPEEDYQNCGCQCCWSSRVSNRNEVGFEKEVLSTWTIICGSILLEYSQCLGSYSPMSSDFYLVSGAKMSSTAGMWERKPINYNSNKIPSIPGSIGKHSHLSVRGHHKWLLLCWHILLHEWPSSGVPNLHRAWKEEV